MVAALHPVDLQPAVIYIKLGALNDRPATGYGVVQARARCWRRGPLKSRLVIINFIEVLVYSTRLRGSARNIYECLKKSKRAKACMGPRYFFAAGPSSVRENEYGSDWKICWEMGNGGYLLLVLSPTAGTICPYPPFVPHIAGSGNMLMG